MVNPPPNDQITMINDQTTSFDIVKFRKNMGRTYDLEGRTERFATDCRELIRMIPVNTANIEDSKQLARSSGSVAANYIEANEAVSKKDFVFRIKLCRKEAKESRLWLNLFYITDNQISSIKSRLVNEATELIKIFNAIIAKTDPGDTSS